MLGVLVGGRYRGGRTAKLSDLKMTGRDIGSDIERDIGKKLRWYVEAPLKGQYDVSGSAVREGCGHPRRGAGRRGSVECRVQSVSVSRHVAPQCYVVMFSLHPIVAVFNASRRTKLSEIRSQDAPQDLRQKPTGNYRDGSHCLEV